MHAVCACVCECVSEWMCVCLWTRRMCYCSSQFYRPTATVGAVTCNDTVMLRQKVEHNTHGAVQFVSLLLSYDLTVASQAMCMTCIVPESQTH